ncbi:MAG: ParB/RepB/Spo0J family partition protein [Bacilli bacterium]|nr:ParB/RepB/Spo0J family partition protein [Bacilli bacterium]
MNLEPNVQYINVEEIIPNRFQPRLTFDDNALKELAMSIKEHGIIQPLVLRKLTNGKFEIIAGERRYKASQIAGLTKVPAIIANLDDNTSAEVALVENLQRRNLSAIEEAKSYKKLLDRGYLTQDQLAKRLGVSQSGVANKVRLLNLCEEVQDALMNEKISERHARSLLQLDNEQDQIAMLNKIIKDRLTVRQLDNEIKKVLTNEVTEEETDTGSNFNILNNDINRDLLNQIETLDINNNVTQVESKSDSDNIEKLINETNQSLIDKYEIFDIPTAEESQLEEIKEPIQEKKQKIISGDINSIKTSLKELETEIKDAGFQIETEDYDFEDLYQIIIKIEK